MPSRRGPPTSAAATSSSTLWAALPPRHGVRLLGCRVCEGGREAHPAARRPAHLRHAHAPGAQRAGGNHFGVARACRYRVHYAHLCAQPTGEAGPRGREHLVVDEAYEVRTVGSLTCDFVLPRRSGNRKRFSDRFFRPHMGEVLPSEMGHHHPRWGSSHLAQTFHWAATHSTS